MQIIRRIDTLVKNLATQEGINADAYSYDIQLTKEYLIVDIKPIENKRKIRK